MTTATEIMHVSANANEADKKAQELTELIDQDWEHEATLYTFDDESVLVISGPQLNAYASIDDAKSALQAV